VHSRQAHGNVVQLHHDAQDGLLVTDGFDGHATTTPGLLLTISVADCVPVFLLDPEARAIALLHAGWRGVAGDVLEAGLDALAELAGTRPEHVWMHAGPAICERCYEVGPEVHAAIGLPRPEGNTTIDLRGALARRAQRSGIALDRVTISAHCTKCGPGRFFSHRAGERGRQMALLGVIQ
jgi:YfiH family protein